MELHRFPRKYELSKCIEAMREGKEGKREERKWKSTCLIVRTISRALPRPSLRVCIRLTYTRQRWEGGSRRSEGNADFVESGWLTTQAISS
mmetsp:Transcript_5764/g.13539  ORF Transcript_5764/g.13539 Transcript_5764/m.13539 type:complete len:91 (+) Transcript_5764:1413-1685(+)